MAQSTLTQEGNAPFLDTEFMVHRNAALSDPGPAGNGQAWDHSALTGVSQFTVHVEDPMGVAGTHLIWGDTDSLYYEVNADGMFLLKEEVMMTAPGVGTTAVSADYQGDGVQMMAWPASYGTSWSGTAFGSYVLEGETITRSGTVVGVVDGEGSLELPYGSFDVLRVYSLVATNESGVISGFDVIGERKLHTWSYYAEWLKHPLLKITADTLNITSPFPTTSQTAKTEWLDEVNVGVIEAQENNATFGVWPTPAVGTLNVTMQEKAGMVRAMLLDNGGRLVREWSVSASGNSTVDVQGIPAGQYIIQVIGGEGVIGARKVIIGK